MFVSSKWRHISAQHNKCLFIKLSETSLFRLIIILITNHYDALVLNTDCLINTFSKQLVFWEAAAQLSISPKYYYPSYKNQSLGHILRYRNLSTTVERISLRPVVYWPRFRHGVGSLGSMNSTPCTGKCPEWLSVSWSHIRWVSTTSIPGESGRNIILTTPI